MTNNNGTDKFTMINHVLISNLDAKAKVLAVELIMRRNPETKQLNPGVARLCKARGIKDTKNFKGLDTYLPGLVTVHRTPGKKNSYSLNDEAIMALPEAEVKLSGNNFSNPPSNEGYPASTETVPTPVDPPSVEGYYPPSVEGYYPPSVEGSNSKEESSVDSSLYKEGSYSSSDNQGETGFSSGEDYKEPLVIPGETKVPLVEVIEEIQVLPLVSEARRSASPFSPGTALENVDVDNEKVTKTREEKKKSAAPGYRREREALQVPEKPLEAPQSVVDADLGLGDQDTPPKPQKPIYAVPTRSPYHTDDQHETRLAKYEMSHTLAMGKWKQDLKLWESKYGETTLPQQTTVPTPETGPTTLSEEGKAKLSKYSGLRIQARDF